MTDLLRSISADEGIEHFRNARRSGSELRTPATAHIRPSGHVAKDDDGYPSR